MENVIIGKIIKQIRTKNEMSQEELSLRLNVTRQYIYMLENGERNPSPDLMEQLSAIFKIPAPILHFMCLDVNDIDPTKRESFIILKPQIDALIEQIIDVG
jgi:transcriptional regulator with XRE-family HTH domain